jgi:peptide/nickel transport system permease protein
VSRLGFVGQRLLQMVPVAIGVTILVFFMIHLVPGDPARTMLGVHATDQAVAVLHHKWGLDRSLFAQYGLFMNRLFHGNFGDSLFYRISARTLIIERLPATLWLIVYAAVLSVLISVPLATLAATHKNKASAICTRCSSPR